MIVLVKLETIMKLFSLWLVDIEKKKDEIVTGVTIDKDAVNKIYGQENEKLDPIDIGVTVTKLMLREAILKFKEYASSDGYKINESFDVTELTDKILLSIEDAVLVPKKK